MLVRRKLAESVILGALAEQLSEAEQIRHMIQRVATEVAKLSEHLPATIRIKESELSSEERRLANFVDFIGEGRGSQALANALIETERGWRLCVKSWTHCAVAGGKCSRRRLWSGSRSD